MSGKAVQCPAPQDALKQALVAVLSYSGPGRVTDVSFGRYADLDAGWHWSADVTRRLCMPGSKLDEADDTLERKVHQVVERWVLDTARHGQDLTSEEDS